MSIINKMLQDLDRRQGRSDPDATMAIPQVRTVPAGTKDREWFWRIVAALLVASVAWVAWIAWQLQPRESIATGEAFKAAQAAPRAAPAVQAAPVPVAAAPAPAAEVPAPVVQTPAAQVVPVPASAPAPQPEAAKPAPPPAPKASPAPAPKPAPVVAAKPTPAPAPAPKLDLDIPPARILQGPAVSQGPSKVEKRDRTRSPDERAEAEFRRGAGLLNQGRGSEAEEAFAAALAAAPTHEAARQALVAMNLEQQKVEEARRLLQDGVALNPGNARFATVLARILVERRDYAGALGVLNGVKAPVQSDAEYQALRGTVLQRLGAHPEAVEAFQAALRAAPQNGAAWMGLGSSLEAIGRRQDAAEAFRRAADSASLNADTKSYAEQRARQLR
jgi:MSHA biogenesis protein MshN